MHNTREGQQCVDITAWIFCTHAFVTSICLCPVTYIYTMGRHNARGKKAHHRPAKKPGIVAAKAAQDPEGDALVIELNASSTFFNSIARKGVLLLVSVRMQSFPPSHAALLQTHLRIR